MDWDFIRQVDLSSSVVTEIPERTFAECDRLNSVELPNTIRAIRNGAFWNMPELGSVKIPDSISVIAPNAFAIEEPGWHIWGTGKRQRPWTGI